MFVPKVFQHANDSEVRDFIRENGFGLLVSQKDGRLHGTHIPMELSEDGAQLSGHVSKANQQWKDFKDGDEVMAVFTGPHTYISSSWYDHENVPTWNYVAVHVYGKVHVIEGEALVRSLKDLVDKYEKSSVNPVRVESMTPEFFRDHINALVGFVINVTEVQAAYKLSQNRDRKNYTAIISELEKRGDHHSQQVADAMKKIRK